MKLPYLITPADSRNLVETSIKVSFKADRKTFGKILFWVAVSFILTALLSNLR